MVSLNATSRAYFGLKRKSLNARSLVYVIRRHVYNTAKQENAGLVPNKKGNQSNSLSTIAAKT